jgi:AraC-like DNA-binding protein
MRCYHEGMARVTPLWQSAEISVHRFDHPSEHEDQAYEATADAFAASFVEHGLFDLETRDTRWRVRQGDVFLRHPGMRYRAGFEGEGFNDTCLTLTYRAADADGFDGARSWARAGRPVLHASNRLRYLYWTLKRALDDGEPMTAEHCASEIFREHDDSGSTGLFRDRKFDWYAERVHAVRARLDATFAERHTVSDLARSVGMSAFHFTRVFGELVGQPPHRYLKEKRLRAARAMLRDGRTVTETCFACGFNNLSHFSRSFSRRFGDPPSES